MTCNGTVFSGKTRLIASHIHLADNGDGATGSGDPVINFCGNNEPGFINDGTDYLSNCNPYEDGSAYMPDMPGAFVESMNKGMSLASRIRDIGQHPNKYYFNFHSVASWTYWKNHGNGAPVGMCRGVLEMTGSAKPAHHAHNKCFNLFSNVDFNSLIQEYPGNPDSAATGYVSCKLCTSGSMMCNATVFSGKTRLIASHIHLADNGNGATGSGDPVINFCGDNEEGFINDGTKYLSSCQPFKDGSAYMPNMPGAFVESTNKGMSLASRIMDIGQHPDKYYFNFHSVASWTYWQHHGNGSPVGMCRGVMALS